MIFLKKKSCQKQRRLQNKGLFISSYFRCNKQSNFPSLIDLPRSYALRQQKALKKNLGQYTTFHCNRTSIVILLKWNIVRFYHQRLEKSLHSTLTWGLWELQSKTWLHRTFPALMASCTIWNNHLNVHNSSSITLSSAVGIRQSLFCLSFNIQRRTKNNPDP